MNDLQVLSNFLNVSPTAVSKRLCFVKGSILDDLWHLGDFQFLHEGNGGGLVIMALHGAFIPKQVVADSLASVGLQTLTTVRLCQFCVEEFRECFDDIQKDPTTAFVEFEKVLIASRSDKQIGGLIPVAEGKPKL